MSGPTHDLPELNDEFVQHPHRHYGRMRAEAPAHRTMTVSGIPVWLVTRYSDARAALSDPRLAKDAAVSQRIVQANSPAHPGEFDSSLEAHMLNMDPPQHTRLRKLVMKAFTSRRVAALRPRIEQITAQLLEAMAERSEVDLLDAFAFPLPITVISELLGVDESRRDDFRAWSNSLVSSDRAAATRASGEMAGYLTQLIADKRARPGEDLLTGLIQASESEDRLTENELVSMVFLLLVAGHETTVNLIGNCVLALLRDPEQFAALRENPDLAADAVEEALRFDGPVNLATLRHTTESVRLGEVEIPAGEIVFVALGAANRDGQRFDEPDRFDLSRSASGHLAFGHGIHFCVGAPLARLEGQIAVRRLVERFPELALARPVEQLRWRFSTLMRGLESLPVRPGSGKSL